MILPDKYTEINESLFGLSGLILSFLKSDKTLDQIYSKYKNASNKGIISQYYTIEDIVMAVNLLYIMGAVNLNTNGKIEKCN